MEALLKFASNFVPKRKAPEMLQRSSRRHEATRRQWMLFCDQNFGNSGREKKFRHFCAFICREKKFRDFCMQLAWPYAPIARKSQTEYTTVIRIRLKGCYRLFYIPHAQLRFLEGIFACAFG
mmetsp:Transcript_13991/g.17593  ORF Transcript_13991/g.17593 Transcript_13991/m.17593 type:complete len:122 (-) Transcript_13991:47-412(-)